MRLDKKNITTTFETSSDCNFTKSLANRLGLPITTTFETSSDCNDDACDKRLLRGILQLLLKQVVIVTVPVRLNRYGYDITTTFETSSDCN